MPQLYALLAGVDRYHPNSKVPALSGCENDIRHWQDFLESRFPAGQHNIIRLLNDQATYANVTDHFGPAFLQQAGKGDTVLFAYSGHGSREGAAPLRRYALIGFGLCFLGGLIGLVWINVMS